MRRLLVTRRTVAEAERDSYDGAWSRVAAAVLVAGGNAWVFHSIRDPSLIVEYIEWRADEGPVAPLESAHVREARAAMESLVPADGEEELESLPGR